MQGSSDIRLNFLPVTFHGESFKGYELPYVDDDGLRELRKRYAGSHVFRRRNDVIQSVPITGSAEALGEEKAFSVKRDFLLAEYLVQNGLIRFFLDKRIQFAGLFYPTQIVLESENLMKEVVSDEHISLLFPMFPEYEIESRLLVPYKKNVVFGISISFSVHHLIEATVKDLLEKGVRITDLYVVGNRADVDLRVNPKYRRQLVGRVASVEGSNLRLTDYRDKESLVLRNVFWKPV
jgi:hypothetical protein